MNSCVHHDTSISSDAREQLPCRWSQPTQLTEYKVLTEYENENENENESEPVNDITWLVACRVSKVLKYLSISLSLRVELVRM